MRRLVRHVVGWGFLVLGVAGLALPVLQGWLFLSIGAFLLAPDVPLFARLLNRVESRFPAVRDTLDRLRRVLGREGTSSD
jgi:uncharacterized membrane protein YbaN (DUF454 family)